jgi:hypothetical protein
MYPIGHFAFGACIAFIVLLLPIPKLQKIRRYDLVILPLFGFIALLPDIGALWGDMTMDNAPVFNLFFFHSLIDSITNEENVFLSAVIIAIDIVLLGIYINIKNSDKKN